MMQAAASPVRSFGVSAPKEVLERTWRGDLGVPGVEHHADVFGNDGRLDAVVQLWRGDTGITLAQRGKPRRSLQTGSTRSSDRPPGMRTRSCRSSLHKE